MSYDSMNINLEKLSKSELINLQSKLIKLLSKQEQEPEEKVRDVKQIVKNNTKPVKEGWMPNPHTGRLIKINGPTYKKLYPIAYTMNNVIEKGKHIDHLSIDINKKYKQLNPDLVDKQDNNTQTADVLLFQRLGDGKSVPKGNKIAFKDHKGKRYILRQRRYFVLSKQYNIEKYIGKRVYDYRENIYEFVEIRDILEYNAIKQQSQKSVFDYINCIIIKSVSTHNKQVKNIDLLDEDLFLSKEENGVYNKYLSLNLKKTFLPDEKANSCFVNLIVNRFRDQFNNKKYKFKLDHKSLCELCGIRYKEENLGLSINKSLAFFEKFKIGLCVSGPYGCIFKYKPEKRNKNVNKSHLYIYIQNNHCYEINDNVKKFEQHFWKTDDKNAITELKIDNVSDKYKIRSESIHDTKPIFIKSIDEVINIINNTNQDRLTLIYNDYLETMLFAIINQLNYTPDIKLLNGKIISLLIKSNDVIVTITTSDTKQDDTDVWIDEEDYEEYHKIDDIFYNGLLCEEHISTYNEVTKVIERIIPIGPKSGYFDRLLKQSLLGVDSRKAYTSDFMDIEYY